MVEIEFTDEDVIAYQAVTRLRALYEAYSATSKAHVMVLNRVFDVSEHDESKSEEKVAFGQLFRQHHECQSRNTEAVMALRSAQMRRRMLDLMNLPKVT